MALPQAPLNEKDLLRWARDFTSSLAALISPRNTVQQSTSVGVIASGTIVTKTFNHNLTYVPIACVTKHSGTTTVLYVVSGVDISSIVVTCYNFGPSSQTNTSLTVGYK